MSTFTYKESEMLIKSNFSFNIKSMIRLADDEVIFELEKLSLSIKKSPEDIVDDFRTMFDSLYLKIVVGILLFLVIFFHSALNLLVILFEKYGNDPMKRSIANLIVSQICYVATLSNIVFLPFLTWRVIIGPIQPDLSGKSHLCLIFKLISSASLQSLCITFCIFLSLFVFLSLKVNVQQRGKNMLNQGPLIPQISKGLKYLAQPILRSLRLKEIQG